MRRWFNKLICLCLGHDFSISAWGNENRGGIKKTCSRCKYWEKFEEYNKWCHPEQTKLIAWGE